MKINGVNHNSIYESIVKDSAKKNENKKISVVNKDKIEVSEEAKNLNVVDFIKTKTVSDINRDVSAEKINRIKESIKNGTYKTDSKAIAKSLISTVSND